MMNYGMMSGANGGGYMFFAWLLSVLATIALVLAIAALWKYLNQK